MAELTGPQPKEKSGSLIKPTGDHAGRKRPVSARHSAAVERSEEQSSLLQRAAVRPTGGSSSAAAPAEPGSRFAHDLSQVPTHTEMDPVIQRDVTVINVPPEEGIRIGGTSGRELAPHHDQNLASIERGLRGGLRSFDNSTLVREAQRRVERLQHPPSPIGPCTRRAVAESLVLIFDTLEARIDAAPFDFERLRPDVEGLEWREGDPLAGELEAIPPFQSIEDWRAMASDESECPTTPPPRRRRPPPPSGEFAEVQTASFEPIVQNQVLWRSVQTDRFRAQISEIMMRQVPRLCQQLEVPSDLRPGQVSPEFLTRLTDEIASEGRSPALRLNDDSVVRITARARLRYDPDMEPGREVEFQLRGVQVERLGDDPSPREIGSLHLYLGTRTFAHWFATRYRETLMRGQPDPTNFRPVARLAIAGFPVPQPCFGRPSQRERMEFAEVLRGGELTYGTSDFAFFRRQQSAFQQYIRLWGWNWSPEAAEGDQGERRWDFLSEPQFLRFRTALFSIRDHGALGEFSVPGYVPSNWGQPR